MKYFYKSFTIVVFLSTVLACEKHDEGIDAPKVSVTYSPENPKVGDTVTVSFSTNAEYLTVFTGDAGHEFKKSRIKAIMENDWESFSDTVYRAPLAPSGLASTWNRYLKDYQSLEEVSQDFEFFGAIENIELGVYGDDFPEALFNTTYPDKNQLKFTITDRRIPSGVIIKPNIHLFGGPANQPAFSIFETRFVSSDEDKAVRGSSANSFIPAYFDVRTLDLETGKDTVISGRLREYRTFMTNDPLSARPTEGFYPFSNFYNGNNYLRFFLESAPERLVMTELTMYMNGRATENEGNFWYDLDGDGELESYDILLDPNTGLPLNESDYTRYRGFQGDVYISYINLGTNEYEPWSLGETLRSVYHPQGIQKEYKYVYNEAGTFTITAVATNTGQKQYNGNNYKDSREYSLNDYEAKRSISEITITVRE